MARLRPERRRGSEEVRERILADLHSGRLNPGDRVPSVRRMAERVGADRKTVHRAYLALQREGLVETRPGSGTFLLEGRSVMQRPVRAAELLSAVNRTRAEAAGLGLDPAVFARFLRLSLGKGLRGVTLAVAECNLEQVALFSLELQGLLGVRCRHALLPDAISEGTNSLAGCSGIVTTDFHRSDVAGIGARLSLPVYRVALDPAFPRLLVEEARKGPVVMVVLDRSFASGFFRFLAGASVPEEVVRHFQVVEPQEARAAFRKAGGRAAVYVSPTVERAMGGRVLERLPRLSVTRHVSAASVERLRVQLALDLAMLGRDARA
ncbi:MAG: GntR family transcriptional regulator [Acidobacteriia bacterium]|nr:GntR family transcriptional regulator [Terriglobia bacterium]